MKALLFAILLTTAASAQSVTFFLDNNGAESTTPFPSTTSFPDTSVGQSTTLSLWVQNSSNAQVVVNGIYIDGAPVASASNPNFATDFQNATLAPGYARRFSITFTPTSSGPVAIGYLLVTVAGQPLAVVSTLSGNGLPSAVSLTCADTLASQCDGKTPLVPNSSLNFGNPSGVTLGTSYSITFTVTNNTAASITPTISQELYAVSPFSFDPATPSTPILPGATAAFKVVFTPEPTPGPSSPESATLMVGSASYTLLGNVGPNSPNITYVYGGTNKPCDTCAGYTINMGPAPDELTVAFTITNTEKLGTSYADITLTSPPTVSGTGFGMPTPTLVLTGTTSPSTAITAGQAVTIQPGYSLTFQVTFNGSVSSVGTLPIAYSTPYGAGTVTYTLNAKPTPPLSADLPGIVLICGASPCTSQSFASGQQVPASLQVTTAGTASVSLTMTFSSSVSGISDDPAIAFIAPTNTGRTIPQINFVPASLTGIVNDGPSAQGTQFTIQAGTTAGTLAFTLSDAENRTLTLGSFNILPSKVQITSGSGIRQSPNLVLTLNGYDNSYSAGQLSFNFYDLSGKLLTPNPIQVDATSNFHQYFFGGSDKTGGAFGLAVTFPVSGDVTQVGSVTAMISNSQGQTSTTQTFQ